MSAEDLEFRVLPIIKTTSSDVISDVTNGDSSECHTPRSPKHMIPPAVVCPPAPRKPAGRRPVPCKRRLRRVALFKILARQEIESFFRVAEDGGGDSKRRCM
ncbi:hypothetical protein ACS0TY_009465 [Phlomoides rotata]